MIKQTQAVTTEQIVQALLKPEVAARLDALVSTYQEMKFDLDLQQETIDIEKAKILKLLQDEGIEKADVAGVPVQIVRGTSSRLNKTKFVQIGGSLKQLEEATEVSPKKPYVLIGKNKGTEQEAA